MAAKRTQLPRVKKEPMVPVPESVPPLVGAPAQEVSTRPPVPKTRQGKKAVTFYFEPEVVKLLKTLALETDIPLKDLGREALNELFIKHGKTPIA